jgi:hypothetical protein
LEAFVGNPPESYPRWHNDVCTAFLADMPRRRVHSDDCCPIPVVEKDKDSVQQKQVNFSDDVEIRALDGSTSSAKLQSAGTLPTATREESLHASLSRFRGLFKREPLSPLQQEYLSWHYRLGHLSHRQMQELAKHGRIPPRLVACNHVKCPACIFAKQTRRAWRTKGKTKHIRRKEHNVSGAYTSVDQMESSTPGLVMQSTGNLTRARYKGATVFTDHFSNWSYVHLMQDLTLPSTLEAKLAYERAALTFGVKVQGYRADNGRFADTGWKMHATTKISILLTVVSVNTIKMGLLSAKFAHCPKAPVLAYSTPHSAGPRLSLPICGRMPSCTNV